MSFGAPLDMHREAPSSYLPDGDPGRHGGGTYTSNNVEPTLEAYENIFGPSARDIKQDLQRFKRHGRWHLPDILKGPNQYLTDRIDGLITDATNSPFTSRILPYKYITNVDGKIKWNVWSFDEGLASRVPYESAARTLTQTKRSYAGYFIRQGMAIVLEHNFMMTEAGRTNFKNQLNQLVGSIQLTNDLDVHVALVLAPSYQKTMNERYLTQDKSAVQICREFVELFGFVQKNQNALDILIEEAKSQLRTWGGPMPDFMLCNSKLTFQLTMTPDVTNYVTQGPEGQKKLKTGPTLSSYRGIGIVHTRAFSMETGAPPRDMLRRRVRVAEYYRILPHRDNYKRLFQLYNEERDTWATFSFADLLRMAQCDGAHAAVDPGPGSGNSEHIRRTWNALANKPAPPGQSHGAAHLGQVMPTGPEQDRRIGALTLLYESLVDPDKKPLFKWDPEFLDSDIVYVPGALDVKDWNTFLRQDVATLTPSLPEYIRKSVEKITRRLTHGGVVLTADQERKIKIMIQSVAPYHRNTLAMNFLATVMEYQVAPGHLGRIGDSNTLNFGRPNNWATSNVFDIAATATRAAVPGLRSWAVGVGNNLHSTNDVEANTIRLYHKMALRNYLRFGVPNTLLRATNFDQVRNVDEMFNYGIDLNDRTATQYLDQTLRDKGAWFCPNHFKEPVLAFSNLGDWIGYHALMDYTIVSNLTTHRQTAAQQLANVHSFSMGTLLYDIIQQPDQHTVLYDAVLALLQAFNADNTKMGQTLTRIQLYRDFIVQFHALLQNSINTGVRGFNQQFIYDHMYWLLPRTSTCREEIYCNDARAAGVAHELWKNQVWGMISAGVHEFQRDLTLSPPVMVSLQAIVTANANGINNADPTSINYAVQFPPAFAAVTRNDVASLFKMLAWRLWADQEIPLRRVYNIAASRWPANLDDVLYPVVEHPRGSFGGGIFPGGAVGGGPPYGMNEHELMVAQDAEDVEIVIVRPNIEHYMMGIILGQGGESLGSTFWGQTELSCYDDSMHGIWGMSYKYHERAIVINEKNLIRLWDIAYDGYIGGKDDTAVKWDVEDENDPNSCTSLKRATTDVTRPYRGPSMMVMAFHHGEAKSARAGNDGLGGPGESLYKRNFSSNWPSPIVFYDRIEEGGQLNARADFDNLHVVDSGQFRVFNSNLYKNAYRPYKEKMPNFWELHTIRKNAGLAATENEVSSDALAFQGTMRVLSAESGAVIQETLGSGHHGPDFIGVASLRAGKGYRLNSQPTVHRLV